MTSLASVSAFEAAENKTDAEREATARVHEVLGGIRSAQNALQAALNVYLSSGLEAADKELAAAERAIAAVRAQRPTDLSDVLVSIARAGACR
jgi:flagellar hook-basal body complex protein FliE